MSDNDPKIGLEIQDIIQNSRESTFFGPRPENVVSAAEQEIGLSFPKSYRAFLLQSGAASCLDLEIFGIPDTRDTDQYNPPTFLNVIDKTLSIRRRIAGREPLPHHLIYFAVDSSGGGYSFYIDTSKTDKNGDAAVLIRGPGIPIQVIAPTFLALLQKLSVGNRTYSEILKQNSAANGDGPIEKPKQTVIPSEETTSKNEMGPSARSVFWLQIMPEPCPPDLPVLAQHFGVDVATREVFIYARSAGLDLEQQMEAISKGFGFFADPIEGDAFRHPFVSIDYLITNHPELPQMFLFPQLKQIALDAYDKN